MNPTFLKSLYLTSILLLAGAGSVSPLRAQEGIPGGPLSLETCIRLGLDNSLSVSKSNLEVEKSRQFVREQLANVYPQVSISSSFMWNLRLANVILPGELAGRPGELVPVQFGTKYNINNGAELTQILYNPSVFTGLDAAKESIALAELGVQRTREQVAYDISALYYAVQVYAAQLDLIRFNIAQLDRLVEVTRVTVENGVGARVDLDRIKVNRSNLLIQQENLRQSYEQQVSMLKLTMGLPLEVPLVIPDSSFSESFITQALENPNPESHTDLLLLRKQVEMNEYNVKITRQSYVPTLAAFANTSVQAQANDLKFFGSDDGRWFNATAVGLSLNIPVFDGFRRDAQIKQAEIELLKVRNDLNSSERYVETQFLTAQNKLKVTRSSLASQEENMALAREVYRINQLRYTEGISSLSDVLSAETALRESQSNYISSLIQYRLAELEWIRFSGNMQILTQP